MEEGNLSYIYAGLASTCCIKSLGGGQKFKQLNMGECQLLNKPRGSYDVNRGAKIDQRGQHMTTHESLGVSSFITIPMQHYLGGL